MRKVYRRLERWRSKRQGRARIPDSLWAAAGELARKHGVNPVSRVLGLEFNYLRRVAESDRRRTRKAHVTQAFGTDSATNRRRADVHHRVAGTARRHANRVEGNDVGDDLLIQI